ncbi:MULTISPECIES: SCO family protein [Myxococcus]|uniref:SCO family protein n=1 Tax=Myxococcus llanfairpwllgwyngyllgogerychwyrndrobwllllantysiliogogogochensis TaxID=2590453 RepID=A0A540WRF4_9BACT|nr:MULTISPECIES: SCO family protein [Myxococcus]NTX08847.1 SCO family protein [Myxococcus sp. CA040A]TQF11602.1 SCO family protein [Myxococcus llanfairpwllgwyngyllgogerychwyrndrobwllllantysiliogogogochensis]
MSADSPLALPPARLTQRPGFWAGLAVVALGLASVAAVNLMRAGNEPLPQLGALPDFTFTRQDGKPFGNTQLKGHPFIANFIFTRCPTVCPAFTRKMAQVQTSTDSFGPNLQLVSFSVDPKYDTPERLAEYGQLHGANFARWSFLTGDYDVLKDTIVQGFKVSMGREAGAAEDDLLSIFHGTHFVLVDSRGEIRGYYDSADSDSTDRLLRDVKRLAREEG